MAQMVYGQGDQRATTVCDCCLGTGRMLLAASNYSMRLYGQDIDGLVLKIAKINGALYAPWLCWPLRDEVWERFVPLEVVAVVARTAELVDEVARAGAELVHPAETTEDVPAPRVEESADEIATVPVEAAVAVVVEPPPVAVQVSGAAFGGSLDELVPEFRVDNKGQGLLFGYPSPEPPPRGQKSSARAKR